MNNWISYLIRTETAPEWPLSASGQPLVPLHWYGTINENVFLFVELGVQNDKTPSIIRNEIVMSAGGIVIGGWDMNGEMWGPLNVDEYTLIRPLGNTPEGEATLPLDYFHLAGFRQRVTGTAGRMYPSGMNPFDLEVRRVEFTGTYAGHGWRAEMTGGVKDRDPGVRAVGIYSDRECTAYLYTTGAFVQGPSLWQVKENGSPLTVWYTETPPGNVTSSIEPVHMAVLWASIQEGCKTLEVQSDSMVYQFWDHSQVPAVPPGEWHDTGTTVVELTGTLYRASSGTPFTDMIPGTPLRFIGFDEETGEETTFVSVWPGSTDLIQIDPYVYATLGDAIWANN